MTIPHGERPEIREPQSQYDESIFGELIAWVYRLYRDELENADLSDDSESEDIRMQNLDMLVKIANKELRERGIIDSSAIFGPGARVAVYDGDEVERFETGVPFFGIYKGLTIVEQPFEAEDGDDEATSLTRPQIIHRLLYSHRIIEEADYEIDDALYVTAAIDFEAIDIMEPRRAALPNQRWLVSHVNRLVKGDIFDSSATREAFLKVVNAKHSKVERQLRIDWFLDFLNDATGVVGREMVAIGSQLLQLADSGETEIYVVDAEEDNATWGGTCRGFGIIDTYVQEIDDVQGNRIVQIAEPDIALIIESEVDGRDITIKFPLHSLQAVQTFPAVDGDRF